MPWSVLQRFVWNVSKPISRLIALYAILVAGLTITRVFRLGGIWLLDLANVFAPYWYMPLALAFPLSIIFARQHAAQSKTKARRNSIGARLRAGWLPLLQIALMLYGLVVFAWHTRYKPLNPPRGATIRVVTFNVQGSQAELERAVDWLLAADADVIVLQETIDGYDARLSRLYAAYAEEAHIESSVRVFSRYRILSRETLTLEDSPGWLALRLLLQHEGRPLAVYALHLALPRADDSIKADTDLQFALNYDETRRNAQILRLLESLRDDSGAFIVAGDFNMSDSSLIYDEIAVQLNDAWRAAGTGAGRTWPLAAAIGLPRVIHPLLRIDYLWHSDHLRAVEARLGDDIGSDHLPLIAEFEWLPSKTRAPIAAA